jgi:pimeloyl-ACP methyl ester carboxylesterase
MQGDGDWRAFLQSEARVRFVAVGEHRLRVIEAGGPGEPVLLIHGFADFAYAWHRNLHPLAEAGFRAIAYDFPGCGESALPDNFRCGAEDLAELALGLLDALGVERTHLIGHSMGGGVGLYLAVHHSDRLRRVVLAAPVCYDAYYRPLTRLLRWPFFCALARRAIGPWMAWPVLRREYADTTLLTPQVVAQYRLAARRPDYASACVRLLRDYWDGAFAETARRYGEISVPLHLIWGDKDTAIDVRYAGRLAADTGASLTVVAGGGHLLNQAQPQVFNQTVARFLRGDDR